VERFDVLVVGGGPAGSSCARELARAGFEVAVLDKARFPRDKVCAGWITPPVLRALEVEPEDYAKNGRVLQPIRGFAVAKRGEEGSTAECGAVISYGIRRCELDQFLLERSGAALRLGQPLESLRREDEDWIANDSIRARWLVGAGGHFCPVARELGARPGRDEPTTVVAREIEFEMTPEQQARCPARGDLPALYFERDLRGYGWVVRKGDWLNVGLGRQDGHGFPAHVAGFAAWLEREGLVPPGLPQRWRGHAYLLHGEAPRPLSAPGVLLCGDAAGLAYPRSGEGIRPAVESGLLAARALARALRHRGEAAERSYARALESRFGPRRARVGAAAALSGWLPERARARVAARCLASAWFARRVVVERWFLHREVPALAAG
jgi:geranylgeranyl reductase family protein